MTGAAPAYLALFNTSTATESYTAVGQRTASGEHGRGHGHRGGRVHRRGVDGSPLAAAGLDPIIVRASGPLAVSEDAGPVVGLRRGVDARHPPGRRHRRLSPRLQVVALVAPPQGAAAEPARRRASSRAKSSGPAMRITPSTPVTKPPTLACHARTTPDSGTGLGARRRRALVDRHGERRVRRLARQQLQLTLQLLDLGLNGVQLLLHRQHVTHRRGLGQDGQVLLAAGLQGA